MSKHEKALAILERCALRASAPQPTEEEIAFLRSMPADEVRRMRVDQLRYMEAQFDGVDLMARADSAEGGAAPKSRFDGEEPEPREDGSVEIIDPSTILYEERDDFERAQDALGPREVEHVATSERACGWGKDVVLQSAWDFTDFFAVGGPLLHGHSREDPQLGRVLSLRRARVNGERVWISRSQFLPEGINTLADMIWQMVALDFCRGVSVGFHIRESVNPSDEDRLKHGMNEWSVLVTKAELVELSVTPLPADKAAVKLRAMDEHLTRAAAEGTFSAALVARLSPTVRSILRSQGAPVALEAALEPFDAAPLLAEFKAMREAIGASEARVLDAVRTLRERFDEAQEGRALNPDPINAGAQTVRVNPYALLFEGADASDEDSLARTDALLDPVSIAKEAFGLR